MWLRFLTGLFLAYGLYIWYQKDKQEENANSKYKYKETLIPPNVEVPQPPTRSILHIYQKAAVCSDQIACSNIGSVLMQQGGNAIDAAIGSLLCNGLLTMQSMGLGGGVLITFYSFEKRKAISINGRERASLNVKLNDIIKLENASMLARSPLAIAVPGEVAAYHEAHSRYGNLAWYYIVKPCLDVCHMGYYLTHHQYDALFLNEQMIRKDKLLNGMFIDPVNNSFYRVGQHIKIPKILCNTLKILAEEGPTSFYNGTLSYRIIEDFEAMGSPITKSDLQSYKADIQDAISVDIDNVTIHLPPPPGSGHVIAFIMNILRYFKNEFTHTSDLTALDMHRLIEAFKFGFVKRWEYDVEMDKAVLYNLTSIQYAKSFAELINDLKTFNDIKYYGANMDLMPKPDYGTAQLSLLDSDGNAVSATSSLNFYFGSGRMGSRTGILYNNAMSDFSVDKFVNYFDLPNVPKRNQIKPGLQPTTSMTPLIVTDRHTGDVRLVVGAAGGTRIISTLIEILVRTLWLNQTIKEAIDAPRFHHQLLPNVLQYEYGVLQQHIDFLESRGHKIERIRRTNTAVCGVERVKGIVLANADYRKEGEVDGF
uniref:Gamma-glutamyltransferase n=1 Tax=Glossina brevipalpis TaxID=37001 RepID=A0A1A9WAG9_9MUSC